MRSVCLCIGLFLSIPLLTGCIGDDEIPPPATAGVGLPGIAMDGVLALGGTAQRWQGAKLVGEDRGWSPGEDPPQICALFCLGAPPVSCTESNCERRAFQVSEAAKGWVLEVSIRWPTDYSSWLLLHVEDADGNVVATGQHSGYSSSVGRVALLADPAPGSYEAVVVAAYGTTSYEGVVQLEPPRATDEVRDLLPDLVTLAPTDLRIEIPDSGGVGVFMIVPPEVRRLSEAFGARGCGLEEHLDHGHLRCLRFSNSVGNIGQGPLEIRLPVAAEAQEGRFVQRVYATDGSVRDVDGGAAEFHPYHAHWHNAAANRYAVFRYDQATATRGEEVGVGTKAGVCLANVGLVDLGLPYTQAPRWNGTECFAPVAEDNDWAMGLASNWYDEYPWVLSDQYVDVTGVEDGVYALCSIVNQDGTLVESDAGNNEACAVFRLTGDAVEVLSEEPYHKEAPGVRW